MSSYEKFTAVFLITVLVGVGYMIVSSANRHWDCVAAATAQNYSADAVKKICR